MSSVLCVSASWWGGPDLVPAPYPFSGSRGWGLVNCDTLEKMGGRQVPPAGRTWSVCVEATGVTLSLSVRWKDVLGMGEERRAPRWGAGRPARQAKVRGDIPWDVCTPAGGVSPPQKHTPPLYGFQRLITGIGGPPHLTWCSSHVASGASAVFRKAEHLLASVSWAPSWTNGVPSLPLGIPLYPISVLGELRVVGREPSHRSWVWGAGSMGGRAASVTGASYFSPHRRRQQSRLSEGHTATGMMPGPGIPLTSPLW